MSDEQFMRAALSCAQIGLGRVNPNPLVGAVVVHHGVIIGRGGHEYFGGPHAERNALAACADDPHGATIYVTLEPCCHTGKTPPCTDALIAAGITRVVVGCLDPNPLVAGRGVAALRAHGIAVATGVLTQECAALNEPFLHFITTGRPLVVMKYAMTLDGKIATRTGASRWVSGEQSRERVQQDRHRWAAIMVGVGTVLADDPHLTCRLPGSHSPLRIICDTRLRTPMDAAVVRTAHHTPTLLATCSTDTARAEGYRQAGCEVMVLPTSEGHVDLRALCTALGARGIDSVVLEGGARLNWSALHAGIVNKIQAYLAPKLFGGADAPSPVAGIGVSDPSSAFQIGPPQLTRLGEDLLWESEVLQCSQA
ncbi:bifunctional diaminohydroxyphosphoribosylaminopyrimidine deaminase/5-amino-6-(5-phosphoribosylamino)uracil reductase RibD [Propionibacterium sp.]|uniref:bifunctional diaminohydroxyphosphoribosylaminopyrimidine deaminase/5-amino-6-(5-phosphoribosylamino)uracil reductase RibD n=1 Tax=Propionibacterium sp. TaxID=1977903 RepID=UPI0039E7EE14